MQPHRVSNAEVLTASPGIDCTMMASLGCRSLAATPSIPAGGFVALVERF
jgi:hypothetical protein